LKFGSGAPVIIAVGTGLAMPGYTLIVDEAGAADLYAALVNKVSFEIGWLFYFSQACASHSPDRHSSAVRHACSFNREIISKH
jgi:hypothetical protein